MFVLELSKKIQKSIGVYREKSSGASEAIYMLLMNVVLLSGMVFVLVIGSAIFIYANLMDMATSTNAMIIMMAGSSGVGCYLGLTLNLKSTQTLFEMLQHLADDSLKYRGFSAFQVAEKKSYFLCKWFTMFMMLFFTCGTILLSFVMSLWNIYQGRSNSSDWFLPYRIILPIDRSTISGWYVELFFQAYSGYAFVITITTTVTFFGGCSYYIEACLRQFKYMFIEIDKCVEKKMDNTRIESNIFEIVTFHNKVLEVFDTISEIYSAAIFCHLLSNVLFFAGAIYQTEMTIGRVGLDLFFNVLCVLEGLSYTFILCYFANLTSHSMAELANVVYESDWYFQKSEAQKLLLLIISRAQKPNIFMGLKIIYCSLESFSKLNRNALTYYMIFRNVSRR